MATDGGMAILLVEDDDADAHLARDDLQSIEHARIVRVRSIAEAVDAAAGASFDVAVLDLSLPDGWGLDTILTFANELPAIPVVVLSGSQGSVFETKAARAGAAGFLPKSALGQGHLADLVDVACERSSNRLERPQRRSPETARIYGQVDLDEAVPEQFELLVGRYRDLVELALEQASFKGDYRVRQHLEQFANELGDMRAGPRDVIAIHTAAVRARAQDPAVVITQAVADEQRLVVLELMGYLVLYYRLRAMGTSGRSSEQHADGGATR